MLLRPANAQTNLSMRASQYQLEILGPAGLASINFDSRFPKKESGLGFRIGLGFSPLGAFGKSCNSGTQISLPAGFNYLIGKNTHYFELGAGGVLAIISATKRGCPDFEERFFSDNTQSYTFITLGYRHQPFQKKGLTYRAFVSPLFQTGFSTKLWGGVSLGHRF